VPDAFAEGLQLGLIDAQRVQGLGLLAHPLPEIERVDDE
jgi:hypothetical protein